MKLPPGKIPVEILRQVVLNNLGAKRDELVLGPSVGIDGAVIDLDTKSLVVSMDPVTGALERIGWLAVNINANDVATFGAEPSFLFSCILLPEGAQKEIANTICRQMNKAAKNLGIAIAGGHCETTPGLKNPIVVGCTMGLTEKGNYVTAGGAKRGDKLILTKSAGIEGTAILASDREQKLKKAISPRILRRAKQFFNQTSVVQEAIRAFKMGVVDAMHDPTEGGIIGGVYEMAEASNLGVEIRAETIPVKAETAQICNFFKIDPLRLASSGALLIAAKPNAADKMVETLKLNHIGATIIGEFLENPKRRLLRRAGERARVLPKPASDHLWLALSRK